MPTIINDTPTRVPLDQVRPHPENPRDGDVEAIKESIRVNGFYGYCVVQESTGHILAGNHRYLAAQDLDMPEIPVVYVDVEDEEAMRILLADNRTSDVAAYHEDDLADLLEHLWTTDRQLDGTGYSGDDLDDLLDDLGRMPGNGEVDDPGAETSRAEELQEEWGTERGQLWQVGRHRLLCGDATDETDVERLLDGAEPSMMWSDPPYGINFQSDHRYETPQFDRIKGDEEPLLSFMPHAAGIPVWYVCCRWDVAPAFMSAIEAEGYDLQNWIVWYKPAGGMGDLEAQYKPTHETILYASAERSPLLGGRDEDLWEVNRDDVNEYEHPTQKPVQLPARAISNHADVGGEIYDPFAGSGTGIIAAEQEDRTCYAMEVDPGYCAVILERCSEAGMECELIE